MALRRLPAPSVASALLANVGEDFDDLWVGTKVNYRYLSRRFKLGFYHMPRTHTLSFTHTRARARAPYPYPTSRGRHVDLYAKFNCCYDANTTKYVFLESKTVGRPRTLTLSIEDCHSYRCCKRKLA